MKVLMISPQPFFTPRGTPISVYQRLSALSELGHEVDLLTYPLGEDAQFPGVKIHRIARIPFIRAVRPGPSFSKLLLDILLFFKTFRMILRHRYDVLHTHEEAAFFALPLAFLFRGKHIYDRHSSLAGQVEKLKVARVFGVHRLFDLLEQKVVRSSAAVITIGKDLADLAQKIQPETTQLLLQNLPIQESFQTNENLLHRLQETYKEHSSLTILYSGNLQHYQGIDLMIASAEIVARELPQARFLVVGGTSSEVGYWKQVVQDRSLSESVLFLGTVPVHDMLAYLDIATVVVSPRLNGMSVPLKLYTYLSAGKPIVATNVSAHTQVLHEGNSILIPPDARSFANGILKLLSDPDLRSALGKAARELSVESSDPGSYLRHLNDLYRTVGASSRAPEKPITSGAIR